MSLPDLRAGLVAVALGLASGADAAGAAPALPEAAMPHLARAMLRGSGELTYLGFAVYDGFYWAPHARWTPDEPFALDVVYHRSLNGARIAERSDREIAQLGYGTPADRLRWLAAMKRLFPDVSKADRLTAVNLPQAGVEFFLNGGRIGAIADPAFAKAFFAIWLDPRTSEPELRKKLLGAP